MYVHASSSSTSSRTQLKCRNAQPDLCQRTPRAGSGRAPLSPPLQATGWKPACTHTRGAMDAQPARLLTPPADSPPTGWSTSMSKPTVLPNAAAAAAAVSRGCALPPPSRLLLAPSSCAGSRLPYLLSKFSRNPPRMRELAASVTCCCCCCWSCWRASSKGMLSCGLPGWLTASQKAPFGLPAKQEPAASSGRESCQHVLPHIGHELGAAAKQCLTPQQHWPRCFCGDWGPRAHQLSAPQRSCVGHAAQLSVEEREGVLQQQEELRGEGSRVCENALELAPAGGKTPLPGAPRCLGAS